MSPSATSERVLSMAEHVMNRNMANLTPLLPVGISLNQAVCTCLCSCKTCQAIVLRKLFKPSKDWAGLRVCNEKSFLVLGFGSFVSDIISGLVISLFGPLHLAPSTNH